MRRGFTKIELLVTVGLVAAIAALTLCGVAHVRETAARIRCANHLRQIGLAVHSYESSKGRLPTGGWNNGDFNGPFKQLAPWLEIPSGFSTGGVSPPLLVCPVRGKGTMDYAVNGGGFSTSPDSPYFGNGGPGGAFRRLPRPGYRLAELTAGTSHTLLAGEKRVNVATLGMYPQPQNNEGWSTGWDHDVVRWVSFPSGPDWRDAAAGWFERDIDRPAGKAFGSSHAGGLNVVTGDGSVRFVSFGVIP